MYHSATPPSVLLPVVLTSYLVLVWEGSIVLCQVTGGHSSTVQCAA